MRLPLALGRLARCHLAKTKRTGMQDIGRSIVLLVEQGDLYRRCGNCVSRAALLFALL